MKVWIWIDSKSAWRQVDRDSTRFDWAYPHAPPGMVRFQLSKNQREYVCWGETREEAAEKANARRRADIEQLTRQIQAIESRMVKP